MDKLQKDRMIIDIYEKLNCLTVQHIDLDNLIYIEFIEPLRYVYSDSIIAGIVRNLITRHDITREKKAVFFYKLCVIARKIRSCTEEAIRDFQLTGDSRELRKMLRNAKTLETHSIHVHPVRKYENDEIAYIIAEVAKNIPMAPKRASKEERLVYASSLDTETLNRVTNYFLEQEQSGYAYMTYETDAYAKKPIREGNIRKVLDRHYNPDVYY